MSNPPSPSAVVGSVVFRLLVFERIQVDQYFADLR